MIIPDSIEGLPLDTALVSGLLDLITPVRGSLLARGADRWSAITAQPEDEGSPLVSQGGGQPPRFSGKLGTIVAKGLTVSGGLNAQDVSTRDIDARNVTARGVLSGDTADIALGVQAGSFTAIAKMINIPKVRALKESDNSGIELYPWGGPELNPVVAIGEMAIIMKGTGTDTNIRPLFIGPNSASVGGMKFFANGTVRSRGIFQAGLNSQPQELGDVGISRDSTPGQGYIYFGNGVNRYMGYNGTQYYFNGAAISVNGTVYTSSRSLKKGIKPWKKRKSAKLSPTSFQYKSEPGQDRVGFVAEDVKKVLPEAVIEVPGTNGEEPTLGIDPMVLIAKHEYEIQELREEMRQLNEGVNL